MVSLEGVAATRNPSVPIIAVPTTAGTASETTINYVITDTARRRKVVCADPRDIPVLAVVDPEMMASAPRALKVATGLDALTHAIEGYVTPGSFELSDMFHLKAIQMIARALAPAADGDAEAIDRMAMAQYIAGMGYSNVGLGLVHGMAHPLGAFFGAPHGVANGILLPSVLEYNAPFTGEKYRDIAAAFRVRGATTDPIEEVRARTVGAIRDLAVSLGNPTRISEVGATEADVQPLAEAAFEDVCTGGATRGHPPSRRSPGCTARCCEAGSVVPLSACPVGTAGTAGVSWPARAPSSTGTDLTRRTERTSCPELSGPHAQN